MKNIIWGLLAVLAVVLLAADHIAIRLEPNNSYFVFQFPRWTETHWIDIDTRDSHDD